MKKSTLILVSFAVLVTISVVAQIAATKGYTSSDSLMLSGKISERTYEALPIKHLDIRGPIKVILTAGLPSRTITADESILDKLVDSDPDPERLLLELPSDVSYEGIDIIATISIPDLETISLTNSAGFESSAPLTFKNNRISSTGYSDIKLDYLDAENIHISSGGSTNIKLSGKSAALTLDMSGSAAVDASSMIVQVCEVNGSGSTTVSVHADSLLNISTSGSSEVSYSGAAKINYNSGGSGSLRVL